MLSYKLNIADYILEFKADADGPELIPSARFQNNFSEQDNPDVIINVHSGKYDMPPAAKLVFTAPFVEEIDGIPVKNRDEFWNIYKATDDLFISSIFPLSSNKKKAILKFSLTRKKWDLWFEGADNETDPLEYPLDGLILYYLTVINCDIMLHASGVNYRGRGYVFSGISGKGKTTIARLWDSYGASVVHDDRLILRRKGNGIIMYNTPVYNNDVPAKSPINSFFLIEHGSSNKIKREEGVSAVSFIMANCIQHNWDIEIISRLLNSVSFLCDSIPVKRLSFTPDISVVKQILENE